MLKSQHQKAIYILIEIAKNEQVGTLDERNENHLAEFLAIVEENNNKGLENRQKAKPAFKRNWP